MSMLWIATLLIFNILISTSKYVLAGDFKTFNKSNKEVKLLPSLSTYTLVKMLAMYDSRFIVHCLRLAYLSLI